MKRILIVTASLGLLPVQLAWAAPPSATVSQPPQPAVAASTEVTPPPSVVDAPAAPVAAPTVSAPVAAPAAPVAAPYASNALVEPSPYGPSAAEQNQKRNRERIVVDPNRPATLIDGNADYAFGGMGGISVMYTRIAGKNAPLVCGEGAVIIDHALTLGGGGCGLPRMLKAQEFSPDYDSNDRMTFGYGGAIGRYHFRSRKLVNISVGALVGAGSLTTGNWDGQADDEADELSDKRHDAVFVFEPQVGAHINLTRWLRAGAVAGYRLVSGVDSKGLSSAELSGITAGGQLQAGWF